MFAEWIRTGVPRQRERQRDTTAKDGNTDDYALVLKAGSSRLKFCVYRWPELENWRLEPRGQIEGSTRLDLAPGSPPPVLSSAMQCKS